MALSFEILAVEYQTTRRKFSEDCKFYHSPPPSLRELQNSDRLLCFFFSCLLQFLPLTLKYSETKWMCYHALARYHIWHPTTDLYPVYLIFPPSIENDSWRCVNNSWWIFWINVKYRCVFTVAFITYTAMFFVYQPRTGIIHSHTPVTYNWQTLASVLSMAKLRAFCQNWLEKYGQYCIHHRLLGVFPLYKEAIVATNKELVAVLCLH